MDKRTKKKLRQQIRELEKERDQLYSAQLEALPDAPRNDAHLWVDTQPGDMIVQLRHPVADPGSGWPGKTFERGITALGKKYILRGGSIVGFKRRDPAKVQEYIEL